MDREPLKDMLHENGGLASRMDRFMSSLLVPAITLLLVLLLGFLVHLMLSQEPDGKYVTTPEEPELLGGLEVAPVEEEPETEPTPEVVVEPEPEPTPTPPVDPDVRTVTVLGTPTDFLNVRNQPSVQSEILGRINPGEVYEYVTGNSEWYLIDLGDYRAWASSQYLEFNN